MHGLDHLRFIHHDPDGPEGVGRLTRAFVNLLAEAAVEQDDVIQEIETAAGFLSLVSAYRSISSFGSASVFAVCGYQ